MPTLHVPASMRALADGRSTFALEGTTLRQVFDALADECPALAGRIVTEGALRTDIAVAIDGTILDGGELVRPVASEAEIYLVPPIGGGALLDR